MRAPLRSAALAALLVAAAALPAAAQQAPAAQPATPAAATEWSGDLPAHFDGITLSAEQKRKIAELQKEYHARMDALRDSAKAAGAAADDAEVKKRLAALMTQEHAAFKALLDEDGRRRFDANMAKMHGAGHGAGHEAGKAGEHGAGHGAGHGTPQGSGRPPLR
jgi:hypothetical protein